VTERFTFEKHFRAARRGPNDRVLDGWVMTDNLTGATYWGQTKREVEDNVPRIISREREVAAAHDRIVSWAANTKHTQQRIEVWLNLRGGSHIYAGLVSRDGHPERIAALLDHLKLADLPEEKS
jgi:hypothetical protein